MHWSLLSSCQCERGGPSRLSCGVTLQGVLQRVRLMPSTKRRVTILHGLSGVLRPGRLTLLLGPPSSGKTTLLKALSGKLVGKGDLEARLTR